MRHGINGLLVGTLVVWRITHLLAAEAGPANLLARLRRLLGSGFWGTLMDCFYCLSLWVAAPVACFLAEGWRSWAPLWLALSAGAILLERATAEPTPAAAQYVEDKEH
jgi:hypothetical protein